jgi:phenylalanyl-tRNA synthetase beta subunit
LTGHFGLAVELNAIYKDDVIKYNKIKDYFKTFENTNILEVLQNSSVSKTELEVKTKDCKTYILVEINSVNVKRSDFFVRTLLYDLGMNPKNNWVDFSNLFMYLTGQPIHFFDADKIK